MQATHGFNKKSNESQKNILFQGDVFNAFSDKVLYKDDFGIIGWKGGEVRQPFYIPNPGWGWHDGIGLIYKGNSTDDFDNHTDDRSSTSDGSTEFYFTRDGERNIDFTMNDYGAYFMGTIIKEVFDVNYPAYKVEILMGDRSSGSLILTRIKNDN